ncbi:MAG: Rpn family recombination-promoting nuclease/putative transposase [Spirochaetota bacterium]
MARPGKPYDAFFRTAFSPRERAWELTQLLAPELAARFTAHDVHVDDSVLADPHLRSQPVDLLIHLRRGEAKAIVYVLYEHKSSPDRWVSLQMLRYMGAIWQRSRRPGRTTLPRIEPIVLYHGKDSWRRPRDISELVDGGGGPNVPRFAPRLVNLADIAPDRIRGSLGFVVALLGLKYVRRRLTEAIAELLAATLDRALADPEARDIAQATERMYAYTRSATDLRRLATIAGELHYHRVREDLMTWAEELIREGRQEGRQEGREEGLRLGELRDKRAVLVRLVSRRFALSEAERGRIEACDDADALDAALDEFAAGGDKASILRKLGD